MNKTLLGAVSAYAVDVTNPQSGGAVSVTPNAQSGSAVVAIPQANADGTYNINLPEEYKSGANVVATDQNTPLTDETDEGGDEGDDSTGSIKKYLPFIIGGGLLLFFFMRKK